jgi:hypothetical protein
MHSAEIQIYNLSFEHISDEQTSVTSKLLYYISESQAGHLLRDGRSTVQHSSTRDYIRTHPWQGCLLDALQVVHGSHCATTLTSILYCQYLCSPVLYRLAVRRVVG